MSAAYRLSDNDHERHFPARPRFQIDDKIAAMRARRRRPAVPDALLRNAIMYGGQIAAGRLDYADAVGMLGICCLIHWAVGPSRFDWVMSNLTDALIQAAEGPALEAAAEIRAGLQVMLDARAPRSELRERAYVLARARMLRPECDQVVENEIALRLRAETGKHD